MSSSQQVYQGWVNQRQRPDRNFSLDSSSVEAGCEADHFPLQKYYWLSLHFVSMTISISVPWISGQLQMKLCNKHQSNPISARSSNLEVSAAPCYVQDPGVYIQCCKAEKSAQVMREMENYSIDIPSMSGYRWSGTDCIKLKNNNKIMNY